MGVVGIFRTRWGAVGFTALALASIPLWWTIYKFVRFVSTATWPWS